MPRFLRRDPAGDREQVALGHALLERGDDLLVGDLLALEVALHQLVGVLGDLVHQLLAVLLGLRLRAPRGSRSASRCRAPRPSTRTPSCRSGRPRRAPRARSRSGSRSRPRAGRTRPSASRACGRSRRARGRACSRTRAAPGPPRRRGSRAARSGPRRPSPPLTTNTAASTTRSARERVGDEARLAGRVDQVDLAAVVLERGHGGADRHPALLLVGLEVADGRAVVHLAEPVDRPRPRTGSPRRGSSSRCPDGRPGPRCGSDLAALWATARNLSSVSDRRVGG